MKKIFPAASLALASSLIFLGLTACNPFSPARPSQQAPSSVPGSAASVAPSAAPTPQVNTPSSSPLATNPASQQATTPQAQAPSTGQPSSHAVVGLADPALQQTLDRFGQLFPQAALTKLVREIDDGHEIIFIQGSDGQQEHKLKVDAKSGQVYTQESHRQHHQHPTFVWSDLGVSPEQAHQSAEAHRGENWTYAGWALIFEHQQLTYKIKYRYPDPKDPGDTEDCEVEIDARSGAFLGIDD